MSKPRDPVDWGKIEAEYRAGQLSIREIARENGISEGAVRKRAKAANWTRALADRVRKEVREKLTRLDGSHEGTQAQRASDDAIADASSDRGVFVVTSHRRDIEQLHGLKRVLATRLSDFLHGVAPDGPFIGDKETPGDLLEKLSRVTARLIPLERQAFNLDAEPDRPITVKVESDAAFSDLVGALESAARSATANSVPPSPMAEDGASDADTAT